MVPSLDRPLPKTLCLFPLSAVFGPSYIYGSPKVKNSLFRGPKMQVQHGEHPTVQSQVHGSSSRHRHTVNLIQFDVVARICVRVAYIKRILSCLSARLICKHAFLFPLLTLQVSIGNSLSLGGWTRPPAGPGHAYVERISAGLPDILMPSRNDILMPDMSRTR